MNYSILLFNLLLLICPLAVNSLAQDGPSCNTYQKINENNDLGSTVQSVYVDDHTIYAACMDYFTGGLGISIDGGNHFSYKTTTDGLGSNGVMSVYAAGNTIYAATLSYNGTDGGLSISTDGGNTFKNKTIANGLAVTTCYGYTWMAT